MLSLLFNDWNNREKNLDLSNTLLVSRDEIRLSQPGHLMQRDATGICIFFFSEYNENIKASSYNVFK